MLMVLNIMIYYFLFGNALSLEEQHTQQAAQNVLWLDMILFRCHLMWITYPKCVACVVKKLVLARVMLMQNHAWNILKYYKGVLQN